LNYQQWWLAPLESRWSYEEIPLLAQQFERRMSHAHGQESPALEASDLLFQPGRAKIIGSKAEWASLNSQFRQAHCMGNHRHNSRNRDRTGCSQQLKLRHYRKTAQPADPSQKDAQDFTCRRSALPRSRGIPAQQADPSQSARDFACGLSRPQNGST
jgi:hypothetical protein